MILQDLLQHGCQKCFRSNRQGLMSLSSLGKRHARCYASTVLDPDVHRLRFGITRPTVEESYYKKIIVYATDIEHMLCHKV